MIGGCFVERGYGAVLCGGSGVFGGTALPRSSVVRFAFHLQLLLFARAVA